MIYTAHRFATEAALHAARAAVEPAALDVIGVAHGPPALGVEGEVVQPGAALPGYHAIAAWNGAVPPEWQASVIPNAEAPRWWGGIPREAPQPAADAALLAAVVDDLVEATARGMQYKSAAHCAGYVASTIPQWAAEAAAFIAWRDVVWATVYALDPQNPPPSIEAALALLPAFVRPQA